MWIFKEILVYGWIALGFQIDKSDGLLYDRYNKGCNRERSLMDLIPCNTPANRARQHQPELPFQLRNRLQLIIVWGMCGEKYGSAP